MKKIFTIVFGLAIVLGPMVSYSATNTVFSPTATTNNATEIKSTSAILNGIVNPGNADSSVQFSYSSVCPLLNCPENNKMTFTPAQDVVAGSSGVTVSFSLESLLPNTTYYFRVMIFQNDSDASPNDAIGNVLSFKTLSGSTSIPTVTTKTSNIVGESVILSGLVNLKGSSGRAYFEWGETKGYGVVTDPRNILTTEKDISISATISTSQLVECKEYFYRAVVEVPKVYYGEPLSFKAPGNCTNTKTATCSDGIKNQDETGIDQGGACATSSKNDSNYEPTDLSSSSTGLIADCPKDGCGFNELIKTINNVIRFILVYFASPLAAIIFAYAGFLYLSSGGSEENIKKAKKIIKNVLIGYVIILAAFLIVKTIMVTLGFTDAGVFLEI